MEMYQVLLLCSILYSVEGLKWALEYKGQGWNDYKCNVAVRHRVIEGKYRTYVHDDRHHYCAYMGIPYAKPPTGNRRFMAPQKYSGNLKRHYKHLGSMCMQKSNGVIEGSEDCLFLNVYTPFHLKKKQKQCRKKYPVMFWIHGGSFNTGSGDYNLYGPDYLVRQGVILVTFNYRLGVLGFLSNPQWEIYGNMGLQDQIMALKWVNENIEAFGGDKNRITIFGESAGAASVHYLMMDNSTENLYQRAILQSGSLLNPWARQFNTTQRFIQLKELTNLTEENKNTIKAEILVETAVNKVPNLVDDKHGTNPVFSPIFQTYMTYNLSKNSIIIRDFVKDLWLGKFPDKDTMWGFNNREGLIALSRVNETNNEIEYTLKNIRGVIPLLLYKNINETWMNQSIMDLSEYYNNVSETKGKTEAYIELMGDAWFLHGLYYSMKSIHQKMPRESKTYFYRLSDDSYSIFKNFLYKGCTELSGVSHTDDLGYLFAMSQEYNLGWYRLRIYAEVPDKALETHRKMVTLWTNFAKTGDPLSSLTSKKKRPKPTYGDIRGIEWELFDIKKPRYLDMTIKNFEMKNFEEQNRMNLWNQLHVVYQAYLKDLEEKRNKVEPK